MGEDSFDAAGALAPLYRAKDWSATSLGAPETWTPALRSALDLILHTRYPVSLMWGPDFVQLYNEAYVPLIGEKHPAALGAPTARTFSEAWDQVGPLMREVYAGEPAVWVENELVPLVRNGFLEDCYFTFSYSPVHGPDGTVEGVVDVAAETTAEVLSERRMVLLGQLRADLAEIQRPEDLAPFALGVLRAGHPDLPEVRIVRRSTEPDVPLQRLPEGHIVESALRGPAVRDLVVERDGSRTLARVPLRPGSHGQDEQLLVTLSETLLHDAAYLTFIRLIASSLGHALDRLEALAAERRVARNERELSETLQRSLLTLPSQQDELDVAVRYQPAVDDAQVGGDWYDSFVVGDGSLTLAIGDVTGHDRDSAAGMGQIRSLMRGIAFTLKEPPSRVLAAVDSALAGLGVNAFATAVLARVEPHEGDPDVRRLVWSNAGHLPPVLVRPDGSSRLLETDPEALLGLHVTTHRSDHEVLLEPGDSVLFYTDGLIERRGVGLDHSLAWLRRELVGRQGLDASALCDHLIAGMPGRVEDDVALLALRYRPRVTADRS